MAAGIVASSILAFTDLKWDAQGSILLLLMTTLLAFVMVSNFRYRSFKDLDLKQRLPFWYLPIALGVVVVVALHPEVMLFVLFMTYAVLGAVFGILGLGKQPTAQMSAQMTPVSAEAEAGDDLHEEIEDDRH